MPTFRVMVVDDEPSITRMLRSVVQRAAPAEVLEFNDAPQALEHYRANPGGVDLIVCDLRMPKLHGMRLCRHVRETDAKLPIIILTAYASPEAEAEAKAIGVNEFVEKPFRPQPFVAAIRRLLGLPVKPDAPAGGAASPPA